MRHFSLIKFLTFSSFTTSSDALQSGHAIGAPSRRAQRLQQSIQSVDTNSNNDDTGSSESQTVASTRREYLKAFGGVATLAFMGGNSQSAGALDMDAFVNSQLEADTKNCDPKRDPKCIPKLNEDQALCKYGQSGNARSEACKRVKAAGLEVEKPAQGKSLGGAYAM